VVHLGWQANQLLPVKEAAKHLNLLWAVEQDLLLDEMDVNEKARHFS
jgi:hypothetical protein